MADEGLVSGRWSSMPFVGRLYYILMIAMFVEACVVDRALKTNFSPLTSFAKRTC